MICLFIKFLRLKLLICVFECVILRPVLMRRQILSVREVIASFDHATSSESLRIRHLLLSSFVRMKQLEL